MDEEDLFEEEINQEAESERAFEEQQEKLLNDILKIQFPINLKAGYIGSVMQHNEKATLQDFLDTLTKLIVQSNYWKLQQPEKEYEQIKANNLIYLDGTYKDNKRANENYQSGKQLIVLDLDDANYEREEIEENWKNKVCLV